MTILSQLLKRIYFKLVRLRIYKKKAVIGARASATKSIPPYSIAVGNPAKVISQWKVNNGW
jgi:hypothetical protein